MEESALSAPQLILIDGMTGSGKSTTAQRLWLHLQRLGRDAAWHYEHDTAHPVWRTEETAQMLGEGSLDFPAVHQVIVDRWGEFAATAQAGKVTILESSFFQSAVGFLLAMNADGASIAEHVWAAEQAIALLSPALIYFRQDDVAGALRATFADRQADGYEATLIGYLAGTPYGRARDVHDFSGLLAFCEAWRDLVDQLYSRLRMNKLAIENSARRWPEYERQITDFLGLPAIPDDLLAAPPPQPVDRFPGRYRDCRGEDVLAVAADGQGLYLDDARGTRLFHREGNRFLVQALNLELAFEGEDGGRFRRLCLNGNLPGLSPQWRRLDEPEVSR
jgi:hypothetical protein